MNLDLIISDYQKYPDKYKGWKGGAYWHSRIELYKCVDVLMQLLFLGAAKAARELIHNMVTF